MKAYAVAGHRHFARDQSGPAEAAGQGRWPDLRAASHADDRGHTTPPVIHLWFDQFRWI